MIFLGNVSPHMEMHQLEEDTSFGKQNDYILKSSLTNQILIVFTTRPDGTNCAKIAEEIVNNYVGDGSEIVLIDIFIRGALDLYQVNITTFEGFCNKMQLLIDQYV